MITLKDIKVSKNRIPVQNAVWLRPTGGLTFKLYYPHGGDWSEINLTNNKSGSYSSNNSMPNRYNGDMQWNSGNIIVAKCIPMKPMIGSKYFFADGRIKFKNNGRAYWFDARDGEYKGMHWNGTITRKPRSMGNWHNPYLITVITKAQYEKYAAAGRKAYCITKFDSPIYVLAAKADKLTCSTASPYFVINAGYLKCTKESKLPETTNIRKRAVNRAKQFIVYKLSKRGGKPHLNRPKYISKYLKSLIATSFRMRSLSATLQRRRLKTEMLANALDTSIISRYSINRDLERFRYVHVIELYKSLTCLS